MSKYHLSKKVLHRADRPKEKIPLGTLLLWRDYDKYVALTKTYNNICMNLADIRWIGHFNYLLKQFGPESLKQ